MQKNQKYRFAPKVYGRGVVPISREGRLFTFVLVIVIVGAARLILGPDGQDPGGLRIALFIIFILLLSLFPLYGLRSRTNGKLKWRRGVKDIDWE